MYYYVFEQPQNKAVAHLQDKIRMQLEDLKIVGEIAKTNPVQRPEDLTKTGVSKGYNTIVIVATDPTINHLTSFIAKAEVTLGIIPLTPRSSLFNLIGIKSIEEAVKILPHRRILKIDTGRINEEQYFLTKIDVVPAFRKSETLKAQSLTSATAFLDFGSYRTEGRTSEITIMNGLLDGDLEKIKQSFQDNLLDVYISSEVKKSTSFFNRVFGRKEEIQYTSIFHTNSIRINANPLMAVIAGDEIVSKTPVFVQSIPKFLKIIVSREKSQPGID